uniref:SH2 domain-containing protein n=1 Tax=Macrostomum lignano TaxID=282301 RepID=A0A1I8INV8_9PLAT
FRRKELPLRPDILLPWQLVGLPEAPETLLPCRDDAKDVELFQAVRDGRIRLALVDHNVLRGKDAALASGVFMVIDHHVKEGIWTSKVDTTIELVGSCSSLVAIRLLNNDSVISNRLKTTPGLARALRGAILLDTANMLPAAGKAKPQDEAALNLLESLDSEACDGEQSTRAADYAALLSARRDLSRFAGVDHLRRDVKTVCGGDGGSVVVGLASLATSVAEFLRRSDAAKAIKEFSAEVNCSILLLLGIEVLQQSNDAPPDGAVDIQRDLAILYRQLLYQPANGRAAGKAMQDKDQLQCHARVKHHQGTTGPIDPSNEAYFHGLMTPELAEERLLMMTSADDYSYEKPDGLFLLRSCLDGNFAVSALDSRSGSSVSHYPIVRAAETNGYRLASSRHSNGFDATFPGPVELIRGHPTMVKLARVPCPRPSGTSPLVLAQGVTADELTWSAGEDLLAGLHRRRPWYHEDCLDRAEAERRLASGGHVSGDFLVRQRRQQQVDDESIGIRAHSELAAEAWHYRILAWKSRPDWLAIEGANRAFRTLIELIDYYHLRRDGLMCRLRRPQTRSA